MRKRLIFIFAAIISVLFAYAQDKPEPHRPDLEKIREKTCDESSKFYYPHLLSKFMANDTTMTGEEYEYFYYGTMFQEDYDPYRPPVDPDRHQAMTPLYHKTQHTRAERDQMLSYAKASLADNPIDLEQLKVMAFVYEANRKDMLAKIWKHKLNQLLRVIAHSGTGLDTDNAWVVAYPRHEFDFLNMMGVTLSSQEFVAPYYERAVVRRRSDREPEAYYFDLSTILEQYYLKHPSER